MYPHRLRSVTSFLLALSDLTDYCLPPISFRVYCYCKFALCKDFVSHARTYASDLSLLMFLNNQIRFLVLFCLGFFTFRKTFSTLKVLIGV